MQDIGFNEVAAYFRSGRIRPYRVEAAMKRWFIALLEIDLTSLAPSDHRAALALEAIEADKPRRPRCSLRSPQRCSMTREPAGTH